MIAIQAGLQTLEAVGQHDTLLIGVVQRGAERRRLVAAGKRKVVILRDRGALGLLLPIGVARALRSETRGRQRTLRDLILNEGAILRAVQEVERIGSRTGGHIRLVLHRGGVRPTLLGLDQHHAVGAARTVDGCGGGVLEDRHRRDVARVDGVERVTTQRRRTADAEAASFRLVVLERYTVDDVQRIVAGADGGTTTDANLCAGTRLTAVQRDIHTSGASGEQLRRVGDHTDVRFFGVDRGNGTRHRFPPLRAVARHDDCAKVGSHRLHHEAHVGRLPRNDGNILHLWGVPDTCHTQARRTSRQVGQQKPTVHARDGAALGALDRDRHTLHRQLAGRIDHPAGNRAAGTLCLQRIRQQQTAYHCGHQTSDQLHSSALLNHSEGFVIRARPDWKSRSRTSRQLLHLRPHHHHCAHQLPVLDTHA